MIYVIVVVFTVECHLSELGKLVALESVSGAAALAVVL